MSAYFARLVIQVLLRQCGRGREHAAVDLTHRDDRYKRVLRLKSFAIAMLREEGDIGGVHIMLLWWRPVGCRPIRSNAFANNINNKCKHVATEYEVVAESN